MKTGITKILSFTLAVLLVFTVMPMAATAQEAAEIEAAEEQAVTGEVTQDETPEPDDTTDGEEPGGPALGQSGTATSGVTITIAPGEQGDTALYIPEGVPVTDADLLAGVSAVDENGGDVTVTIADVGGLDTQSPAPKIADGLPQPYIITYQAEHPVAGDSFAETRECYVTTGITALASIGANIDLEDASPPLNGDGWSYANNVYTVTGDVTITSQTTVNRVAVASGATVNITLDGATIDVSNATRVAAFLLNSGADVTLELVGTNTLKSSFDRAGLQAPDGTKLTIEGSGTLNATGGDGGAGIGGGYNSGGGEITISGGTVNAEGGNNGAGIGGGYYGAGGEITISGGTVEATGGNNGAGIGGGNRGDGGNITILGGEVKATGGSSSAGIGGGNMGGGGDVTISGGTVNAEGGDRGAGIGGGYDGDGGNITISGGTVNAEGGDRGAGIGGGFTGNGGTVKISGNDTTVTATGKGNGRDVGSGYGSVDTSPSAGGTLSVTDGATLDMTTIGTSAHTDYKDCTVTINGERIEYNAQGEPIYSISGRITAATGGAAISGASVQLKNSGGNVGIAATTNASGDYSITGVPAGTGYTIEVSASGYVTGTISEFNVSGGNVTGKNIALATAPTYNISGTITAATGGAAISGASVQLKNSGGGNVGSAVTTNASGDYSITGVPAGTGYTIEVSASGYVTGTIPAFNVSGANVTGKNLALATAPTPTTYTVTVNSGTTSHSTAAQNATVTITANTAPTGQTFDKWTTTSNGVIFADANSTATTFIMPGNAVTVTATYKDIPPGNVLVDSITVTGASNATTITAKGGTLQMQADVRPDNADNKTVTWSVASGTNSATINATGLLTAVSNGAVTVRASANDGSGVYGERVITISRQTTTNPVTPGGSSSGRDSSSNSSTTSTPTPTTIWLDAAGMEALARNAQGGYVRTRATNQYGVRTAAWAKLAGLRYEHDTTNAGAVEMRLTINNPTAMSKDTMVSGRVTGTDVNSARSFFERWFKNMVQAIHFDHTGPWGQTVRVAARVDLTAMDDKRLYFYYYDKAANSYRRIESPEYRVDKNGYLHFSTEQGGAIIISEGELEKK